MITIIHEREKCVGCGACAALCPSFWEMKEDGKVMLKGAKGNNDVFMLEIEDMGCNQLAAESCPVNCIHVHEKGGRTL